MLRSLGVVTIVLTLAAIAGGTNLRADEGDDKNKSAENLKKLALGIISYADANGGKMPPAVTYGKDRKPLHSWRVLILPYIDEDNLFKQFKLDEPWDSENNKKLIEKMPKLFEPVAGKPKDKHATHYQVLVGGGAAFPGPGGGVARYPASFTDGTSNTILIVEAADAVPWTKPADLTYDPKKPLPKFGGLFKEGFHAAFADGRIRFIGKDADKDTLRAAITASGGEVIDLEKLK
jgi:hypothetical protein